ncbi:uncharacterized protein BDW70DRAFT_113034 [Aspergillus foveolatus]|uniref:uncharacterized protein n=1 Tax=Aspergillus foveolatus TaxID=210207 RepID=UPI003CCDD975
MGDGALIRLAPSAVREEFSGLWRSGMPAQVHVRVPGCQLSGHSGLNSHSRSTRRLPRCLASGLHPFGSLPFPPNTLLYDKSNKSIGPSDSKNLANTAVRSVILLMTSQPMCSGRLDAACPRRRPTQANLLLEGYMTYCGQRRTVKVWINHGGHTLISILRRWNGGTGRPASKVEWFALC